MLGMGVGAEQFETPQSSCHEYFPILLDSSKACLTVAATRIESIFTCFGGKIQCNFLTEKSPGKVAGNGA